MADTWEDDDEDDWDKDNNDDDILDQKLGLKKPNNNGAAGATVIPTFQDEVDLAVQEKAKEEQVTQAELKKKGNALLEKKRAEQERKEELEIAKRMMELEAEAEANMSPEELRAYKQRQVEEADHALTNSLFGSGGTGTGADDTIGTNGSSSNITQSAGDKVVMKDLKDHLKHARRVADCMKQHGKIHLTSAFLKEVIQESKDVLDDDSVTELIKVLNIIKNDKVQAAKRKAKGQASKTKKVDKSAEAKARQIQIETFGDNDKFDNYDVIGEDYEDAFF